jgi:hypothetical protein
MPTPFALARDDEQSRGQPVHSRRRASAQHGHADPNRAAFPLTPPLSHSPDLDSPPDRSVTLVWDESSCAASESCLSTEPVRVRCLLLRKTSTLVQPGRRSGIALRLAWNVVLALAERRPAAVGRFADAVGYSGAAARARLPAGGAGGGVSRLAGSGFRAARRGISVRGGRRLESLTGAPGAG